MTEFTINRENWMTPDHPKWDGINHLVNDDGTMCCLGFFCNRVSRIPKEHLVYVPLPSDIGMPYDEKPSVVAVIKVEDDLSDINDSEKIDAKTREKKIAHFFKQINYKAKFIGKYKKKKNEE